MERFRRTNKMLSTVAALVAAGGIFIGGAAQAKLMIEVSDGITTNSYSDNLVGDLDARDGVLISFGVIGNFSLVLTSGKSKPFIGGESKPVVDLGFDVVSNGTGGTLTIKITDTDFLIGGSSRGSCGIGGLTQGSIDYSCFYDSGNAAFATTSLFGNVGPSFGNDGSQLALANGLTSLTAVLKIDHEPGDGKRSSGNADMVVPEPQTLALFGVGLLGLGFLARRRTARPSAN